MSLRHLALLTDEIGITEHARYDRPRPESGYCSDDAGRLLAVASILPSEPEALRLATTALRFMLLAHDGNGSFRLRMGPDGRWTDDPPSDDAVGRVLYGLGTAVSRAPWPRIRETARQLFDRGAEFRSVHPRAMAYAALGAVSVLNVCAGHDPARRLVVDAADALTALPATSTGWEWPEPRLSYANALIPEALLAAATVLGDDRRAGTALGLLDWLVQHETRGEWFSFTPVGGGGPADRPPGFDQQPIEAWAIADAAARAFSATGDPRWSAAVVRAAAWFVGDNDAGADMYDPLTGGGFDGLESNGVNRNQGAESSLAFVATMARARHLLRPPQAARPSPAAARAARR